MSRSVRAPRMVASLVALAIVPALAFAACDGSTASSGTPTAVPSGVVHVDAAKDGPYTFTPSSITVPAGKVTFSVRNAGNEEHEFEVFKGETVVDEIEGLVPGLTKSLTVDLAAGDYTFVCKLNGHDQLGMKGTLTVK
jgi:iron uptake system component EfeO